VNTSGVANAPQGAGAGWRWPRFDVTERLVTALVIAGSVHAVLLFGLTFIDEPKPNLPPTLEVTLSQFSEAAPEKPDFAAPTSQSGSGDELTPTDMTTTQASDFASDQANELPQERIDSRANNEPEAVRPLTVQRPNAPTETVVAREDSTPGARSSTERPYLDVARQLATLQARLDNETSNRAMGPRVRRITSVSTLATDEAYYLNAWRREVEQIGNLNYPSEARSRRIHGSVRMLVVIAADGTLTETQILETSGFPVLDQAALDIVRLAAPFPVFPESMRKRMDTLEIIRTWQFQPSRRSGDGFSG
jgi:protein TonB